MCQMVEVAGRPTRQFPVVEKIEVRERTSSGYLYAKIWAIMPPSTCPRHAPCRLADDASDGPSHWPCPPDRSSLQEALRTAAGFFRAASFLHAMSVRRHGYRPRSRSNLRT